MSPARREAVFWAAEAATGAAAVSAAPVAASLLVNVPGLISGSFNHCERAAACAATASRAKHGIVLAAYGPLRGAERWRRQQR